MKEFFKGLIGVIVFIGMVITAVNSCGGCSDDDSDSAANYEYQNDYSSYDDESDNSSYESSGSNYNNSGYNNGYYNNGGYEAEPYESPKTWHPCQACGGTGQCRLCHGTGQVQEMSLISKEYETRTCPNCHGSGICGGCDGAGGFEY